MKKLLSVLLACAICLSVFSVCAFAVTEEKEYLTGDTDGNGKLETADALLALRAAAGIESLSKEQVIRADINEDGSITLYDARQILRGSLGLVKLEPSGAFKGFTCCDIDGKPAFESKEALIEYVNTNLNRIKTERPGLTKTESSSVSDINVSSSGIAALVKSLVSKIVEKESDESDPEFHNAGDALYSVVPVEGEDYVSNLTASDIMGAKVLYDDGKDMITVQIAVPDTDSDNIKSSGYSKVVNTENLNSKSTSTITDVFSSIMGSAELSVEYRNLVLTVKIDCETGNVKNYTLSYESNVSMVSPGSKLGIISVDGVSYCTLRTIEFSGFNWKKA